MPSPLGTPGYLHLAILQAQAAQPALSPFWLVPPQPEAGTDMPADPSLQAEDRVAILGQLVVSPPASDKLPPRVPQLLAALTLTASPLLPHFRLESFQALRRHFYLPFAVQTKPQKLSFPRPPYSALGGIHLQPQMLLDPSLYRLLHPF